MTLILSVIIWCLYSCLEGEREAFHYYYRINSTKNDGYNEHTIFVIQRFVAWLPHFYILSKYHIFIGLFLLPMFPFFHDGFYYTVRNHIDKTYPKGFFSQSLNSSSKLDSIGITKPVYRIAGLFVGILGIATFYYLK